MLGSGLFVVATGFANAATVTTANQSVLRAGPGSTFSVIAHMPAGTKVEVTDCAVGWCQVDFNGIAGLWVLPILERSVASKTRPGQRQKTFIGATIVSVTDRLQTIQ